jgi:hypothetical protein
MWIKKIYSRFIVIYFSLLAHLVDMLPGGSRPARAWPGYPADGRWRHGRQRKCNRSLSEAPRAGGRSSRGAPAPECLMTGRPTAY